MDTSLSRQTRRTLDPGPVRAAALKGLSALDAKVHALGRQGRWALGELGDDEEVQQLLASRRLRRARLQRGLSAVPRIHRAPAAPPPPAPAAPRIRASVAPRLLPTARAGTNRSRRSRPVRSATKARSPDGDGEPPPRVTTCFAVEDDVDTRAHAVEIIKQLIARSEVQP